MSERAFPSASWLFDAQFPICVEVWSFQGRRGEMFGGGMRRGGRGERGGQMADRMGGEDGRGSHYSSSLYRGRNTVTLRRLLGSPALVTEHLPLLSLSFLVFPGHIIPCPSFQSPNQILSPPPDLAVFVSWNTKCNRRRDPRSGNIRSNPVHAWPLKLSPFYTYIF